MRKQWLFFMPLLVLALLVWFMNKGLSLNPREVPSPLVDKPAPAFVLPVLHQPQKTFDPEVMKGQVWLLNVWASWCVACRQEHPLWVELARQNSVPIIGLNYKDDRQAAINWLANLGDPYVLSVMDANGRVGIDFGVYGVPETYVIDAEGIIRYKQIGPVSRPVLDNTILPLIRELQG